VQPAWEAGFQPLLLSGYSDFRAERDSTDSGVVVFSYQTRGPSKPDDVIAALRTLVQEAYPCYAVLKDSLDLVKLRCSHRPNRFKEIEEIQFLVDSQRGRVFVLTMTDVPSEAARYEQLEATLKEARDR
jgi:hypothetical protein